MGKNEHVIVVGAGIGGLAAALDLAVAGLRVTVVERAPAVGGKVREVPVGAWTVDSGPTTLTMRWAFEQLFARAGADLAALVPMRRASMLGRFAWAADGFLDLRADHALTADAIGRFAGTAEAAGYRRFVADAKRMYGIMEHRFIRRTLPDSTLFALSAGPLGLMRLRPFATLWDELGRYFKDARLRQLFSRASSDHGTSPFQAPAAAMLLAHLEHEGVWAVEGGMGRLPDAMAALAQRLGVTFRLGVGVAEITTGAGGVSGVRLEDGEPIRARAVVMNGEPSALATGLLGGKVAKATAATKFPQRSLSATTWATVVEARGLELMRRTVFFSRDTRQEFELINAGRLPVEPTITAIALDRADDGARTGQDGPERVLLAVNAPPSGDRRAFVQVEIDQCMTGMTALMARCGLELRLVEPPVMTIPATFHRMFPASGGALYGTALTGTGAAFARPGARTKVRGLYVAGASAHPGPGLSFAALSGQLAAKAIAADLKVAK